MQTEQLIQTLGYAGSPRFLREEGIGRVPQYTQVFRRAFRECGVRGVYLLRDNSEDAAVPAVYVAEADSSAKADEIHRKVWNQNVVPFLIVRTPDDVRLYSGFHYRPADPSTAPEQRGALEVSVAFGEVLARLNDLRATAIDDGSIWRSRGEKMDSSTRVDWKLLNHLRELGKWLRSGDVPLQPSVAHALIGKFVYLRYLRDRNILSDRKLATLRVEPDEAFGGLATLSGVKTLIEAVDVWLNGSVFPFSFSASSAPTTEHVRRVAGVFLGDDPLSGQLHLDFRAYDFSFIPIETLSVIYEQFLSADAQNRENGAYYTPIHLVNFMLSELDGMRRLEPGRTVLDPSCGSGAFLVQCYRRLVERHVAGGGRTRPSDLRDILVKSVFGVDRDADACQVTALSLLLAMLDYVDPPDLQSTPQFKLPDLIGQNIFVGDFFNPDSLWARREAARRYDWIVGNPPWIQASNSRAHHPDDHARRWMNDHASTHAVTNYDVAESFAWKAMEHVAAEGAVGLLLPAMTLFKDSSAFRARYFTENDVAAVANFTNLRRDLFAKAETPAAAFFTWGAREPDALERATVAVFSPLVANQETNRTRPGHRVEPWVITVDSSELQQVSRSTIRGGEMLPWKVAMWGGPRDMHLLRSMRSSPTLESFAEAHGLALSAGLELRERAMASEPLEEVREVAGKKLLDVKPLKDAGRIYAFPRRALEVLPSTKAFARRGRGVLPLSVCRPPHVIVSAARTFATFSDEFIVVPPRQIGIAGHAKQTPLLKALALYLNSDFVTYHDFFTSPQGGIREGRSTLDALRRLPTPLDDLAASDVEAWARRYDALARVQRSLWQANDSVFARGENPDALTARIAEMEVETNEAVSNLLRLTDEERVLVRDLVHVRRGMADGLVPAAAVGKPKKGELEAYAKRLELALDHAIDDSESRRHEVVAVQDGATGMVCIELAHRKAQASRRNVVAASDTVAKAFARIRERMERERGQWLYFDRNLFLFDGPRTYIMKPFQRLWWTERQALADADHLVAEALAPEGNAE